MKNSSLTLVPYIKPPPTEGWKQATLTSSSALGRTLTSSISETLYICMKDVNSEKKVQSIIHKIDSYTHTIQVGKKIVKEIMLLFVLS